MTSKYLNHPLTESILIGFWFVHGSLTAHNITKTLFWNSVPISNLCVVLNAVLECLCCVGFAISTHYFTGQIVNFFMCIDYTFLLKEFLKSLLSWWKKIIYECARSRCFWGNIAFINSFENLVQNLIKFSIKETNSAMDH